MLLRSVQGGNTGLQVNIEKQIAVFCKIEPYFVVLFYFFHILFQSAIEKVWGSVLISL